jgi:hypothetical protein
MSATDTCETVKVNGVVYNKGDEPKEKKTRKTKKAE